MVLHEEPRAICSNSGSGGGGGSHRSSLKKSKQKKTPQRGMGVAQLEELRMREQQQKSASSSGLTLAPAHQPSLPFLASDTNVLLPPAVDPNSLSSSGNGVDFLCHPPPLAESSSAGCPGSAESGLLACPHDPEVVMRRYNLNSSLQSYSLLQRWPNHQHHQQQFQMMYRTSSSSSSGVTTLMEPPSNQSYSSNKYHIPPDCPEEERVVSMKRPWPFLPDCSSSHTSFPCKMPAFNSPLLHLEEPFLVHGNGSKKYVPTGPSFRESNWTSNMNQTDWKSYYIHHDNHLKENDSARDDSFLSLGPSEAPLFSRTKHTFSISDPTECPKFSSLPCQRSVCEANSQFGNSSQPPFYSFLPMGLNSQEDTTKDCRAESSSDAIDLNLKL